MKLLVSIKCLGPNNPAPHFYLYYIDRIIRFTQTIDSRRRIRKDAMLPRELLDRYIRKTNGANS